MKYDQLNHPTSSSASRAFREKTSESEQNCRPLSYNDRNVQQCKSNQDHERSSEQPSNSHNGADKLQYELDPFLRFAASNRPGIFENRKWNGETMSCDQSSSAGRKRRSTKDLDSFRNSEQSKNSAEEEEELSLAMRETYGLSLKPFLESCFSKKYSFRTVVPPNMERYRTPSQRFLYSFPKWETGTLRELQTLKWKLNSIKEQLNEYDLNEWHRHTRSTNPADLVMRRLRSDVKVEFLTQAWCKFYELVSEYNLIPKEAARSKSLYTLHLCEAPGAFVASLNHYLKLNHPEIDWHWKANSLNPYYEGNNLNQMINDDRFMLQTIDNWDFGPDMTGDITHPGYPDHLLDLYGDQLPHLITADGSFDCQDKPEEQENKVSWLHLKETLTALRVLRRGGHFVIKMFTFFECDTVCLLYLLGCAFESINVMKPATSKEGNSEVYVVCREFKGADEVEPYLIDLLYITPEEHQQCAMFPFSVINRTFPTQVLECARKFANTQMTIIDRNILLFPSRKDENMREQFRFVQEKLCVMYIEKFKLRPIPTNENIVPMMRKLSYEIRRSDSNVMERREYKQGSHADQLKRNSMVSKDIFKKISEELATIHVRTSPKERFMPNIKLRIEDFEIHLGKPISTVRSSQFCHGTYIRIRSELMNVVSRKIYDITATEVENADLPDVDERFICDFKTVIMEKQNYNDAQLDSFYMIYSALISLEDGGDLVFLGYPLLTQFNVNMLCLLKQFFEKIEFRNENVLYLRNIDVNRRNVWVPKLDEIFQKYDRNKAVISFLPLKYITGAENPVYSWVIDVNNIRVLHEIEHVIDFNPAC